jgi:hypothetical protein
MTVIDGLKIEHEFTYRGIKAVLVVEEWKPEQNSPTRARLTAYTQELENGILTEDLAYKYWAGRRTMFQAIKQGVNVIRGHIDLIIAYQSDIRS